MTLKSNGADQALTYLLQVAATLKNSGLKRMCNQPLADIRFLTWPASIKHHHYYENGLLIHTVEVMKYCLDVAYGDPRLQLDVLIPAVIYHDYAKVLEYERSFTDSLKFVKTEYASRIGHVVGSYAWWLSNMDCRFGLEEKVSSKILAQVSHCILSHHGRIEWGSPVVPQTPEALLLHAADMHSSQFGLRMES